MKRASAQTVKPGVATIVRIQGEARYSLGDGNWHPLMVGKMLGAGAVIQTAHDATVDMVLGKPVELPQAAPWPDRIGPAPDANIRGLIDYKPSVVQNMVRMTGGTMLAIDKLTVSDTGLDTVSDTELDLWQGRIYCSVKKLSAASEYLVKIPNGIAGVRGCLIVIDASGWCAVCKELPGTQPPDHHPFVMLLSITGPNGAPTIYSVGEGYQFNPQTGQVTSASQSILTELQSLGITVPTLYVESVPVANSPNVPNVAQCYVSPVKGSGK